MAYGISNKCAKNFCKWTVLVHVIVEDVVNCFFIGTRCITKHGCNLGIARRTAYRVIRWDRACFCRRK